MEFHIKMEILIRKSCVKNKLVWRFKCCWLNNASNCHSNSFVVTQILWIFNRVFLDERNSKHYFPGNCWSLGSTLLGVNVYFVNKALDEQEEVGGTILLYLCGVSELVVWIPSQHHMNNLLFKNNANLISVRLNLTQARRM